MLNRMLLDRQAEIKGKLRSLREVMPAKASDVKEHHRVADAVRGAQRFAPPNGRERVDVDAAAPDVDVVNAERTEVIARWCRRGEDPRTALVEARDVARHGAPEPGHAVRFGISAEIRVV